MQSQLLQAERRAQTYLRFVELDHSWTGKYSVRARHSLELPFAKKIAITLVGK